MPHRRRASREEESSLLDDREKIKILNGSRVEEII